MVKRAAPVSIVPKAGAPKKSRSSFSKSPSIELPTRLERLLQLIDCCSEAKTIADEVQKPFLAYLLAMAIQEARTELRDTQH